MPISILFVPFSIFIDRKESYWPDYWKSPIRQLQIHHQQI